MSKLKITVTLDVPNGDWDLDDLVLQFGNCLEIACGGVEWADYVDAEMYHAAVQTIPPLPELVALTNRYRERARVKCLIKGHDKPAEIDGNIYCRRCGDQLAGELQYA